jgi:hypothetical protein
MPHLKQTIPSTVNYIGKGRETDKASLTLLEGNAMIDAHLVLLVEIGMSCLFHSPGRVSHTKP